MTAIVGSGIFLVLTYAKKMLCTLHFLQASSASSALLRLLFRSYVAVELAYASTWALFNVLECYRILDKTELTPRFRHVRYVDNDSRKEFKTLMSRKCGRSSAKISAPRLGL